VGVVGNPSDGFGGKTIAALLRNFGATVTLRESRTIEIVRHPCFDPLTFGNLSHLVELAERDGYYGGIRLLYAACRRFAEACRERGVTLPERNFTLQYDTNTPRQVGLGGSSAIITAVFRALMEFYGLTEEQFPRPLLPNFILEVETRELGIAAGLQDRVVQVYGGLVYMDFDPQYVAQHGHGRYEPLDLDLLPPLYLAWDRRGSDSGRIHSPVRHRFEQGDPEVLEAVRLWAGYTDQARQALESCDWGSLAGLLNANFDLRRRIYGDAALGERNLLMVETLRGRGLPAQFPGSGGAVLSFSAEAAQVEAARDAVQELGFEFALVTPAQYEHACAAPG